MTLVLLSGGLDSTVLAARIARAQHPETVHALSVHYGQRHTRELAAAEAVSAHLGLAHTTLDLSDLGQHLTSSLTPASNAGTIPTGPYTAPTMASTVVPGRNAILIALAAGIAAARGLNTVATAVHGADHPLYPDCRPEFITAAHHATHTGTGGQVGLIAPFTHMTKTDIVRLGVELNAPLHLSWSCYQDGAEHCGRCGTCIERAQAFHQAGATDPTVYTDPTSWKEAAQ